MTTANAHTGRYVKEGGRCRAAACHGSTCGREAAATGSTAFVTDGNATVTQGFLYAPFGEITTEYNAGFANGVMPKYTFNAKELDEETGMYYYEARYYNPPVFISRDPLFEQKPWLSPYHYCSNNPVGRVDPSGMLDDEWEYNMGTQTMKWVSATGRDIGVDIVHVKAGNGTEVGSHVCENGLKSCELTGNTTDGYGFHSESLHIQDGYNSADFSYSSYQSDMPTSSSSSYEGNCLGELALGTSIGSTMVDEAAKSSVNLSKAAKEAEALKVFKGVSKVAKGLGALGAFTSVAGAYIDFKNASTAAGQIHAVTNGIMSIVGLLPPWGTAASIAWGMVDIGYGDKIFK